MTILSLHAAISVDDASSVHLHVVITTYNVPNVLCSTYVCSDDEPSDEIDDNSMSVASDDNNDESMDDASFPSKSDDGYERDDVDDEELHDSVDDDGPIGDGISDDELVLFDDQYDPIDPTQCVNPSDIAIGNDVDHGENRNHNCKHHYNFRFRKHIDYSDMC